MTYPHVSARGTVGNWLFFLTVVVGTASVFTSLGSSTPELAVLAFGPVLLAVLFGASPAPVPIRRARELLARSTGSGRSGLARRALEKERRPQPEPSRKYLIPIELPPQPATFVGRHQELDVICEHLRASGPGQRVVVIGGADGIGKSTVAVAAAASLADEYPMGLLYAELSRYAGPHGIHRANAALLAATIESFIVALKKPGESVREAAGRPAQYQSLCWRGPVVIVLDDADDVEVVQRLLPENPRCAVIVTTSRVDLQWPDKWLFFTLEPLDAEDSRKLLQAMAPGALTEDDATALRLVAPMAGHPNAIRLTATQIALRSASGYDMTHQDPTSELAARMEQRWAGAGGPVADRSGDPVAALEVSFGLLGTDERAAVRAAGRLPGRWFTGPALTAALGWPEARAARAVGRLLAAGYVFRQNEDGTGVPTFGMSADVYAFAQLRCAEAAGPAGEEAMAVAKPGSSDVLGTDSGPVLLAEEALRHLNAGQLPAALASARRAVERTVDVGAATRANALAALADIRAELGAVAPAADQARAVIALGDEAAGSATVRALRVLARLERRQNRLAEAEDWLKQAVDLARQCDSAQELILCLRDRAVVEALGGTAGGGRSSLVEAFEECKRRPDGGADWIAGLYWAQSTVLEKSGAPDDAIRSLERGERAALRRAQRVWLGWIAHRLAQVLSTTEAWGAAKAQATRALHTFGAERHPYGRAQAALVLGQIHLRLAATGTPEGRAAERHQARLRLQEAQQDLADLGDPAGARQAAKLAARASEPEPAAPDRSQLAEV